MTERWKLVYAGVRYEPRNADRFHLYYRVDEPGQMHAASGRALSFKKELLPAAPGAMLEVDVNVSPDAKTISILGQGRAHLDHHWRAEEPDVVTGWAAEDRANRALALAARQAKFDDFEDTLRPIQHAYINMGPAQRAQLLAQVVRFISATKGAS